MDRHESSAAHVFQAADAEAALGLLDQGPVDPLFTDLMLPDGIDGFMSQARAPIPGRSGGKGQRTRWRQQKGV